MPGIENVNYVDFGWENGRWFSGELPVDQCGWTSGYRRDTCTHRATRGPSYVASCWRAVWRLARICRTCTASVPCASADVVIECCEDGIWVCRHRIVNVCPLSVEAVWTRFDCSSCSGEWLANHLQEVKVGHQHLGQYHEDDIDRYFFLALYEHF